MADGKTPGRIIREAREARGMSQMEVAVAIPCSLRAVQGWESDEYPPSRRMRANLERVLRIPAAYLVVP